MPSKGPGDAIEQTDPELEMCVPSWMQHAFESEMLFPGILDDDLSEMELQTAASKSPWRIWGCTRAEAAEAAARCQAERSAVKVLPSPPGLFAPAPELVPSCAFKLQVGGVPQAQPKISMLQQMEQALPLLAEAADHGPNACGNDLVHHELWDQHFRCCGEPPGLFIDQRGAQSQQEIAGPQATLHLSQPMRVANYLVQPVDMPLKIPIHCPTDMDIGACKHQEQQPFLASSGGCSMLGLGMAAVGGFGYRGERQCRWHKSAETVGVISHDGHVFTKTAGPQRSRVSDRGATVKLASICMVFDASVRIGGVHRYTYHIMEGELGPADGAGFVFDKKVRRNNIQRMRSVFLNQRGRICLRNNGQVTKLRAQLPPLAVGVTLTMIIDLDLLFARFDISSPDDVGGSAEVQLDSLSDVGFGKTMLRSGFFCAVVTGDITVGLH